MEQEIRWATDQGAGNQMARSQWAENKIDSHPGGMKLDG
jgi:hypothetical protein